MRRFEEVLSDERDGIVDQIAHYLADCRSPRGLDGSGPADAAARTAAMVGAFVESVETRKVAPFVGWIEKAAHDRSGAGWEPGEMAIALDLVESLALRCARSAGGEAAAGSETIIAAVVRAGREAYGRERDDTIV